MEFIVTTKEIIKSLQKVQSIIERKEIKPILSNILIKATKDIIEIKATNLEVSIKELCKARVITQGTIVIDAKKIYEIIKEMPDKEIRFKRKENFWVEVSTGDILFNIVGLEATGFPEVSFLNDEDFQEIDSALLKELIDKTIFASSNDETKTSLNGVFFQKIEQKEKVFLRSVATDGHRLSMMDKELKDLNKQEFEKIEQLEKGIIFPKKGVLELKKLIEEETGKEKVSILCKQNSGFFKKGTTALAIRTVDEEFPNYTRAIPKVIYREAVIKRIEFLRALRRISVIAEEKSKAVSFNITENHLEIYTSNPVMGEGKETIPISYEGETIKFGFNAGYLIDILNAITTDKVTVKIKDKDSAIIIVPFESEEYTCILMPMDIKD